jgi:NADPH:quinone reductase-like Zn-dependent oxidoreductase
LQAGQTVLIHGGSGGVGHFAIQLAKVRGARVLTTVSSDNVVFVRALGADVVIDYKKQKFEEIASELDLVFDLIDGETRERSWALVRKGGRLVSTLTEPSQEKAREAEITAMRYTVEPSAQELEELVELAAAERIRVHIQQNFPLQRAAEALKLVEEGHSVGKTVLSMG